MPSHPHFFFLNLTYFWGCQGLAGGPGPACAPESLLIVSSCAWSPCLGLAQGDPGGRNYRGTADVCRPTTSEGMLTPPNLAKAKPVHPLRARRTSSASRTPPYWGRKSTREGTLGDRSQWQRPEGSQIIKTQVPTAATASDSRPNGCGKRPWSSGPSAGELSPLGLGFPPIQSTEGAGSQVHPHPPHSHSVFA